MVTRVTATQRSTADPRDRQDGLGWVTRAVFGDPRLRLTIGRAGMDGIDDAGGATTVAFAVVPSLERARFLLPLANRRVALAATLAYNRLRSPRTRLQRLAVGAVAALRPDGPPGMPVLRVVAPHGVDPAEVLLTEHLSGLLGGPLHAAIGIRPPDPHHKPTLQLFDDTGRPRGYAKIGWNDATRAMTRAEATALHRLAGTDAADHPVVPGVLATTDWAGRAVTVVRPMPRTVRGVPGAAAPLTGAMLAVARRGGSAADERPLAGSAFLAGLADRARRAGGRIEGHVAALAARHGETAVEFGDWHGDWVPWNLGRQGGRLFAWDWENSGSDVPVGFDLAHQAFQTALSLHGRSAAQAAAHMAAVLDRHGPALGLGPAQRRLVADAYLVELWLRTAELAAGGGGWNPRLHPALLTVLDGAAQTAPLVPRPRTLADRASLPG